jgi:hypothetical protein
MERFYLKVKTGFISHKEVFGTNRPKENKWSGSSYPINPSQEI